MIKKPYNPSKEGAKTELSGEMTYGKYLNIDLILSQQKRLSGAHDEIWRYK